MPCNLIYTEAFAGRRLQRDELYLLCMVQVIPGIHMTKIVLIFTLKDSAFQKAEITSAVKYDVIQQFNSEDLAGTLELLRRLPVVCRRVDRPAGMIVPDDYA